MLNPLNWLRMIGPTGRKASKLYGSIVAQARQPAFYRELGVPDTTRGRYEVLVLHMSSVLNALHQFEGGDGKVGRALIEVFVADMDDAMRELGVGDLSVPKKVKKTAAGLRERTMAYRSVIDDGDSLTKPISEYFDMSPSDPNVSALVTYSDDLTRSLAAAEAMTLLSEGKIVFPSVPMGLGRRQKSHATSSE